nr:YEATS-associated helix-containing protein [uncultured Rhodopila sp.]
MRPVLEVLLVMTSAGLLGGLAGHRSRRQVPSKKVDADQLAALSASETSRWDGELITDLVVGIVAALCVPIFLAVAQSELLKNISKVADDFDWDLLSLAAYCLIASFSSRAFMESLSGQVLHRTQAEQQRLKEGQQTLRDEVADLAEEKTAHASPIAASPAMPQDGGSQSASLLPPLSSQTPLEPSVSAKLSESDRNVINALNSEAYARRSLSGVAKSSGLTKPEAALALARLVDVGLVAHGQSSRTGSIMYQLTPRGRLAVVP